MNGEWMLDNFDTKDYDDNYIDFDSFLQFKLDKDPGMKMTEKKVDELEKEFAERSYFAVKVDNRITDAMATLRVFGKCYLEERQTSAFDVLPKKAKPEPEKGFECNEVETRVFPWLTRSLPIYTHWDGTVSRGLPELATEPKKEQTNSNCFLEQFKNTINGRGYVTSAGNGQVGELMKLALLLRALGNKMPIQIVHKGDLSSENQQKLISAFRDDVPLRKMPETYADLDLDAALEFPKQDVWFVNVDPCIKEAFKHKFQKYANKLLAYMFNSFDEMILIDTDTVPFVDLETVFSLPGYVDNGAFFFQDRNLKGQNTENQVAYFTRMLPSKMDKILFDIPRATEHTLGNRFISGRRNHFMESGVVAIKRSTHFTGMLAALQLNFWSATAWKVHGDKELFWLGQSIAGNEKYAFNPVGAASIGELTREEKKLFPDSKAQELCSNHPGHINGYDGETLLWINSGMTYCKNTPAAGADVGKPLYKGLSEGEIKRLYQSKTVIRAAIVPPPQEIYANDNNGNPERGWTDEHKYCYGYTWCAVSYVGTGESPEQVGRVVNFDDKQTKWFDFIGDLWMDALATGKSE